MQVRVTEAHIERGTPSAGHSCPVALALKEHYEGAKDVESIKEIYASSDWAIATLWMKDGSLVINQFDYNEELEDWIFDFDQGTPVSPFTLKHDGELNENNRSVLKRLKE